MKLSYYINLILELENATKLNEEQSFNIDGFDTAILILDDIQDQSKIRDGKPCFYIINGVEKAKEEAKILQQNAFKELNSICDKRKIGFIGKVRAKILLNTLHSAIKKGQNIDSLLEHSLTIKTSFIQRYDYMIKLFTGGHIKYSFLLGFLFSKNNPSYKKTVISIGEKIGIIRQIFDDINDYKKEHHEPLGDLVNSKKRLPELIFLLNSTNEEKSTLKDLLKNPKENFSKIADTILNTEVKNIIREKIKTIKNEIDLDLGKLPTNYQNILKVLLYKFYDQNF